MYKGIFLQVHFVKCECYGSFEFVSGYGIARKEVFRVNKKNLKWNNMNKMFWEDN